jgi:hypothetical protein
MNPIRGIAILIGWLYDIIMLPFVLLWKLGKVALFILFVIVVSLIVWGIVVG